MKQLFKKGTICFFWENGEQTNCQCDLDCDRNLEDGDIFGWQPTPRMKPILMKVLGVIGGFMLNVEEVITEE